MTDDERLSDLEAQLIQPGWDVYSSDGQRVGVVDEVGDEAFALALEVLPDTPLAVPLDEVEAADDGRVELAVPAEAIGTMGWPRWGAEGG